MCDPVLARADGADARRLLRLPLQAVGLGSEAWFRAVASDDFGKSFWVEYDKNGDEVSSGP